MNGKRRFKARLFVFSTECGNEKFQEVEEELMASADAGSKERGSRILKSSVEFHYNVLQNGVNITMTWTEIFGGEERT